MAETPPRMPRGKVGQRGTWQVSQRTPGHVIITCPECGVASTVHHQQIRTDGEICKTWRCAGCCIEGRVRLAKFNRDEIKRPGGRR